MNAKAKPSTPGATRRLASFENQTHQNKTGYTRSFARYENNQPHPGKSIGGGHSFAGFENQTHPSKSTATARYRYPSKSDA